MSRFFDRLFTYAYIFIIDLPIYSANNFGAKYPLIIQH